MPYIVVTVFCLLSGLFASFLFAKDNTERVEKANNTSYEITINNKETYSCEDYKLTNHKHSVEGECLCKYEVNDYILVYKDGVEVIAPNNINSFKVKEIKTNSEDNASSKYDFQK